MKPTPDGPDGPVAPTGLIKTFVASAAVLICGLAGLLQVTAGGTAFTTETLRRTRIEAAPAAVPDLRVRDGTGRESRLRSLLAGGPLGPLGPHESHGPHEPHCPHDSHDPNDPRDPQDPQGPHGPRVLIVDFVYTSCQTVCVALGSVFQQLQREIQAQGLQDRVGLLSISFDSAKDTAEALRAYRDRMQMNEAVWRVVTLQDPDDRRALLDGFGIVVIPAPNGEFEHNAALHVVTPAGALIHIVDIGDPQRALDAAAAAAATAGTGLKP